jgi:hypothetical protein
MLRIASAMNVSGGTRAVSDMNGDSSTRIEPMPPNILACDSVVTPFTILLIVISNLRSSG